MRNGAFVFVVAVALALAVLSSPLFSQPSQRGQLARWRKKRPLNAKLWSVGRNVDIRASEWATSLEICHLRPFFKSAKLRSSKPESVRHPRLENPKLQV